MLSSVFDYYSVDAGIMIRFKDMGPYDIFKPAWDELSRLVSAGRWRILENVVDDIHGEAAKNWFAENSAAIIKFDPEINEYMNELMADLQNNSMMLIDPMSRKSKEDPFVVMLAL